MSDARELRAALQAGPAVLGLWASIPSSLTAEAAAAAGAAYVVVDQQHGAVAPDQLMAMLQAIQGAGAAPLVRVAREDAWLIGSALDLGAAGVIVPMVQDAAQAARAVVACRYAPEGERSFGPLRADVALGSARPEDLSALPLCLVMIETRAGLEQVEAIAATPGLDGIYIGPSDLALSLGLAPTLRVEHPPVLNAIARVRAAAGARGVLVGLHCLTAADAARFAGEGFAMVTVGSDLLHLRAALAGALALARGA
jgi:4-hydroxy-2-oxoheptanedioate aldolase